MSLSGPRQSGPAEVLHQAATNEPVCCRRVKASRRKLTSATHVSPLANAKEVSIHDVMGADRLYNLQHFIDLIDPESFLFHGRPLQTETLWCGQESDCVGGFPPPSGERCLDTHRVVGVQLRAVHQHSVGTLIQLRDLHGEPGNVVAIWKQQKVCVTSCLQFV